MTFTNIARREVKAMAELKRYEPMTALEPFTTLRNAIDRLFDSAFVWPSFFELDGGRPWFTRAMPVNIWETEDAYVMQVAIPGAKPESVEVSLRQGNLTIKGQYLGLAPESATRIWQGLPEGEFEVTYRLPGSVDTERAEVTWEHGIYSIVLPKEEKAKAKKLPVKMARK